MRMLLPLALLTFAALGPAQHNPASIPAMRIDVPPAGTTVPMLDVGGRPMVEVRVNGKGPYAMILDRRGEPGGVGGGRGSGLAVACRNQPAVHRKGRDGARLAP